MQDRSYCTYIVASRTHVFYVGVTGQIEVRIAQHKNKTYEGFSALYNCNRLVWFERYADVTRAIAREKQIKGWRRSKKIALIEKMNPTWIDLSEGWGKPIEPLPPNYQPSPPQTFGANPGSSQAEANRRRHRRLLLAPAQIHK
jgi:putative endonuclease